LVLCLHGFLDQGAAWAKVAERIAEQGYHFVAPDARGHGRSGHAPPGSDYHFPDYLSDLDGILALLAPSSLRLIGHSMGGTVASLYAGLRPEAVDVLVLAEGLGPPAEEATDLPNKLRLHLDQLRSLKPHKVMRNVEGAAERLRRMTPGLSEAFSLCLAERSCEAVDGGVSWTWDKLHRTRMPTVFLVEGYLETLRRITAPTTVVYGRESWYRFSDLPEREAAIAQCSRHEVEGSHSLHIDAPLALTEIILSAFEQSAS
jgi:pimeloyl-ACP methyl ester carboxylesterase